MSFTDLMTALQAMARALAPYGQTDDGYDLAMIAAAALLDAGYEIVPTDTRNERPSIPPTSKEQP